MDQKKILLHPSRRDMLAMMAGGAGAAAGVLPARAQSVWPPGSPGRIVVAYTAGTSTDTFARMLASQFLVQTGQSFVVENRPGASGWTGTLAVSRAKPDGTTLTFNANGIAIYGLVQKNTFDAAVDLSPLAMTARGPVAILVSGTMPVKTMTEFLDYAKKNEVFYGSSGIGSAVHLYSEQLNIAAGIKMKHVPYRGLGDSLPDFIAGRIHLILSSYVTGAAMIKAGQAKLLAYAGKGGPTGDGYAPTVKEASGVDYEAHNWWALFGPPGMPMELRQKINEANNIAVRDPGFLKLFNTAGVEPVPMTVEEITNEVKRQYADLKATVDHAKIVFE